MCVADDEQDSYCVDAVWSIARSYAVTESRHSILQSV